MGVRDRNWPSVAAGGAVAYYCRPPGAATPSPGVLELMDALYRGEWGTDSVSDSVSRRASGLTTAHTCSGRLGGRQRTLPLIETVGAAPVWALSRPKPRRYGPARQQYGDWRSGYWWGLATGTPRGADEMALRPESAGVSRAHQVRPPDPHPSGAVAPDDPGRAPVPRHVALCHERQRPLEPGTGVSCRAPEGHKRQIGRTPWMQGVRLYRSWGWDGCRRTPLDGELVAQPGRGEVPMGFQPDVIRRRRRDERWACGVVMGGRPGCGAASSA